MSLPAPVVTILLLTASNVFMTFAWYGHLKFRSAPLMVAMLTSSKALAQSGGGGLPGKNID